MIALLIDPVTAEPVGVHRTVLRPDGIRLIPDDEVTNGLRLLALKTNP